MKDSAVGAEGKVAILDLDVAGEPGLVFALRLDRGRRAGQSAAAALARHAETRR